jgi:integrative and conjugative element protein (TIGR02256 family)
MTRRAVAVTVAPNVVGVIAERAGWAAPKETGGLLLGWWENMTVVVSHAVEILDSEATSNSWTRREDTAQIASDVALRDLSHPWLGYVGDWHSHPGALDASPTDELSLRRASREYTKPLALLVYRTDGHLDVRVAYRGRIRGCQLELEADTTILEGANNREQPGEPHAFRPER